jgi:hypothetical protein
MSTPKKKTDGKKKLIIAKIPYVPMLLGDIAV